MVPGMDFFGFAGERYFFWPLIEFFLRCQYFHIRESDSNKDFYKTFVEKMDIRMKENPDACVLDILPQVTRLVPRLNCLKKWAVDESGQKSILELFKDGEF